VQYAKTVHDSRPPPPPPVWYMLHTIFTYLKNIDIVSISRYFGNIVSISYRIPKTNIAASLASGIRDTPSSLAAVIGLSNNESMTSFPYVPYVACVALDENPASEAVSLCPLYRLTNK